MLARSNRFFWFLVLFLGLGMVFASDGWSAEPRGGEVRLPDFGKVVASLGKVSLSEERLNALAQGQLVTFVVGAPWPERTVRRFMAQEYHYRMALKRRLHEQRGVQEELALAKVLRLGEYQSLVWRQARQRSSMGRQRPEKNWREKAAFHPEAYTHAGRNLPPETVLGSLDAATVTRRELDTFIRAYGATSLAPENGSPLMHLLLQKRWYQEARSQPRDAEAEALLQRYVRVAEHEALAVADMRRTCGGRTPTNAEIRRWYQDSHWSVTKFSYVEVEFPYGLYLNDDEGKAAVEQWVVEMRGKAELSDDGFVVLQYQETEERDLNSSVASVLRSLSLGELSDAVFLDGRWRAYELSERQDRIPLEFMEGQIAAKLRLDRIPGCGKNLDERIRVRPNRVAP